MQRHYSLGTAGSEAGPEKYRSEVLSEGAVARGFPGVMAANLRLKQTPALGGWKPVQGHAGVNGLFTSMHRMHRIFSGDGGFAVLNIRESARDHRRSQPLVRQGRVPIILCIDVQ